MTLEFDPRGTSDRPQASSIRSSQKIGQKTRLNAQDDFDQARGSRRFPLARLAGGEEGPAVSVRGRLERSVLSRSDRGAPVLPAGQRPLTIVTR